MNENVLKVLPASMNVSRVCSPIEMYLIIGGSSIIWDWRDVLSSFMRWQLPSCYIINYTCSSLCHWYSGPSEIPTYLFERWTGIFITKYCIGCLPYLDLFISCLNLKTVETQISDKQWSNTSSLVDETIQFLLCKNQPNQQLSSNFVEALQWSQFRAITRRRLLLPSSQNIELEKILISLLIKLQDL